MHQNSRAAILRGNVHHKYTAAPVSNPIASGRLLILVLLAGLFLLAAYLTYRAQRRKQRDQKTDLLLSDEASGSDERQGFFAFVLTFVLEVARQWYTERACVRLDDVSGCERGDDIKGASLRRNGATEWRKAKTPASLRHESALDRMRAFDVPRRSTLVGPKGSDSFGKSRTGSNIPSLDIENSSTSRALDHLSPSTLRKETSNTLQRPSSRISGLPPVSQEILQRIQAVHALRLQRQSQGVARPDGNQSVPPTCGSMQVKGSGQRGSIVCKMVVPRSVTSFSSLSSTVPSSEYFPRIPEGGARSEGASQNDNKDEDEQPPIPEYHVIPGRDIEPTVTERSDEPSVLAPPLPSNYIPRSPSRRSSVSPAWREVERPTKVKRSGHVGVELVNSGSMLVKGVRDRGDWEVEMGEERSRRSSY